MINPTILMLDAHRLQQEEALLTKLVILFNKRELTDKEAFLAIASIATVRNLIYELREGL